MVKLFPMLLRLIDSKNNYNWYKFITRFQCLRKYSYTYIRELDIEISIQIYHQNSLTELSILQNET